MSARTIREETLDAWEKILIAEGAPPDKAHAIALRLDAAMVGHGAPALPNRVRVIDPVADPLHDQSQRGDGGPGEAEYRRTKIMLRTGLKARALSVLEATERGDVVWSIEGAWFSMGAPASTEVLDLLERKLVEQHGEPEASGIHVLVHPTQAGRALLDELAGRTNPTDTTTEGP
jgi:hypothetical protein